MPELYALYSGAAPTTAAPVPVATINGLKTIMQIKLGTQTKGLVVEWGLSFDASAAATPVRCELIETGAIFGTGTAMAAADIVKYGDVNAVDPTTSNFILTTTGSMYNCTTEGTTTASRLLDLQFVAPSNGFVHQFPLGREPEINVSAALRVRVTATAIYNCYAYCIITI